MTERQIEEQKRLLRNCPKPLTREQEILSKELDIRDMMISNLAYHGDYFKMVKEPWYVRNCHGEYDWDDLKKLGVKNAYQRVQQIWAEMKRDFKAHATIIPNSGHDSEGLWYNSIVWDDQPSKGGQYGQT